MSLLLEVLKSIFPIFAIIVIGYLLQKSHWFQKDFAGNISKLIKTKIKKISGCA